jgi:hypothetical protein
VQLLTKHFLRRITGELTKAKKGSQEKSSGVRDYREGRVMEDKRRGRMKEAHGADYGAKDEKAEGQAQQRKGAAGQEEPAQKERTRHAEAK